VGMTRGRQANTAHVVTRTVPADAPPGTVVAAVHRSPEAVLAGLFETSDPQRTALAQAVDSATEAESVRTPAELFGDAAQLATAGRTSSWLDQLVNDGHLTPDQRMALAVEDGATTLSGLLRRVELAGHDPKQVLTDAVIRRSLDDARQITSVLHSRISDRVSLDPMGDNFVAWTPSVEDPKWQDYLDTLARIADERRSDLGRQAANDAPNWAVEALGAPPAPDRAEDRAEWEERAASVASYREMVGYHHESDPLGPSPKPGQVETYATWRSAWRALGRPEADRAEAEMSTGQLRVRIRAYDREKTWAPDHVANQLAGTRQAADKHRHDATLWEAHAAATTEQDAAARLRDESAKSAALATALDDRASQLAQVDEARAAWYAHTAATRAAAERAAAELTTRQADQPAEPAPVTAEEWLAAHNAESAAEDPYRKITGEHDLAEVADQRAQDQRDVGHDKPLAPSPEPDIRDETAVDGTAEKSRSRDRAVDEVRVPTADETAQSVRRAQRALQQLKHRQAAEARHAEDEAQEEVTRWHSYQKSRATGHELRSGPARHEDGHESFVLDASS
jgi:hypothetical protein